MKVSKNIEGTEEIARIFLVEILQSKNKNTKEKGAAVVGLSGELGVGKTAFTQAIAELLGVKSKVTSPTFVLMKKYPIKNDKYKFLFHLDAYRLKNEKELLVLGWDEIISNKEHLVFIEWPENVVKAMPKKYHKIHISHTKGGYRKFRIKRV